MRVEIESTRRAMGARTLVCTALAVAAAALLAPPPAGAGQEISAGPELSEPPAALDSALECGEGLQEARVDPVLLVHATGLTAEENWSWSYRRRLPADGFPTCAVTLPDRAMEDIQRASEYLVFAIRKMARSSGRRVAVVGYSQGAIEPLWALRFWPDIRARVSDYIGLAGPFHGSLTVDAICAEPRGCPPVGWQMTRGSHLLGALFATPLDPRPDYTSIASRFDELVTPAPEASRLEGARNVVLQDLCPGRPDDHFLLLSDLATYALVIDALTHPGPTDPARIHASVCQQGHMQSDERGARGLANFAVHVATWRRVREEPPLRCYADPACRGSRRAGDLG